MQKVKYYLLVLLLVLLTSIGLCACTKENEVPEITWKENEDGSYTFTNNAGDADSIYAWYIMDENDEVVYKTKYSESSEFTYDLKDHRGWTIKGFIRTGTEEDYEQTSIKLNAKNVLGPVYGIETTEMPKNAFALFKKKILSNEHTLPAESVLKKDGSAWEVDLNIPVNWNCPDISNRSFGFYTNGLMFLDEVYEKYCNTNDEKYAYIIIDYIVDWAEQNPEFNQDDEWEWHDDATAMRVLRMSVFYYEFKDLLQKEEKKLIENSLAYQAKLLASDEFYTEKHNHGMHQDTALFAYALLLGDNGIRETYILIAINRCAEYLDYVYTEDGIHKEHSPFYARDVFVDVILWLVLTKDISPQFSDHINQYVVGAQKYFIQIIEPDGTWPSLGDSAKTNGIGALSESLSDNDEYQWIVSNGAVGTKPADEAVFQEGGYAVFRSSWEDAPEEATWMMFVASTFSSTHKHGDDLQVLLYHKGELFVEAGRRDYNYSDEMTTWAYSGYGHNVLLVDGEAYPVKKGENGFQSIYPEALETGITDYDLVGDVLRVTGKQVRFSNVSQTRTLQYDRMNDNVIIEDVLEASEDFEGTLLFHVAEGVEVEEVTAGWNLYRDGELVAVVSVEGKTEFEIETVTGEGKYPYCTWIFNGNETPSYGALLMINISGEVGDNEIITSIDLL